VGALERIDERKGFGNLSTGTIVLAAVV